MKKERWIPAFAGMTIKKGVMTGLLLLISFEAKAQCVMNQDCASLGYTKTAAECSGQNGLKCPFGDKWSCKECKRNCPISNTSKCLSAEHSYDFEDGCGGKCNICVPFHLNFSYLDRIPVKLQCKNGVAYGKARCKYTWLCGDNNGDDYIVNIEEDAYCNCYASSNACYATANCPSRVYPPDEKVKNCLFLGIFRG